MKKQLLFIILLYGFLAFGQQSTNPTTLDNLIKNEFETNNTVFLLFWISDCPYCDLGIKQLVQKTATIKVPLITISFDTNLDEYKNALKEKKMDNFINFCDLQGYQNSIIAKKYNVTKTPTLLQVNDQGIVLAQGDEAFKMLCKFKL